VIEKGAQLFALLVCEINESQSKTERRRLVSDLPLEVKPFAAGQLQLEGDHFADLGFAQTIDVTPTFRKIGDACQMVSAFTVPNGVQTNVPSLFTSAIAHW